MFDSIVGNEPIKAYLEKALQESRLPQTLLFSGPDGIGKSLFAKAIAVYLLRADPRRIEQENHPDLHIVRPEGKSGLHAIDALRAMIDKEHSAPFEAPAKVFIIEESHRMQPAAANALLKTLEEPAPDTTFFLLSSAPQEMLPTILSRCARLSFQPLPEQAVASLLQSKGHDIRFAKLSAGSIGRALEFATHPETEEQRKILFRLLQEKPSYPELAKALEKLEELLEKEEDPVRSSRQAEHLFSSLLLYVRDQHLRKMGLPSHLLFFPEAPPSLFPLPSLKKMEQAVDAARSAYQKNIKLSACITQLLLI